MYFYQLMTKGGYINTLNRQTSTYFAGIYSTRKPCYILKITQNFTQKLHKNYTKISPFTPQNHTHFFQIFTLQKQPKILHLHIHTFPITHSTLSPFYFNHITPNYLNLS